MATFDLLTKAFRLLIGRRYTSAVLGDSQEAFTSTIQIGAEEIWAQTKLIPSSSLPFSSSTNSGDTLSSSVVKYWYKFPLTVANDAGTGSFASGSTWFFLYPSGSINGVSSQLVQNGQITNFISPKYSTSSLANQSADFSNNGNPPGYNIALFSSSNGTTFGNIVASSMPYQFDYKTGILQFTTTAIPTARVYATVYQYIGTTLADTNDNNFGNITASVVSSSVIIANQITSSVITSSLGLFDEITASNALIKNNLWVNGSIYASIFSASNIYITSSQLVVSDNIITLNALSPYVRYSGFEMYDSGSGTLSSLLWDSEKNYFFVSSSDAGYARQIILGPDVEQSLAPGYLALISSSNSITQSIVRQSGSNIVVEGNLSASTVTATSGSFVYLNINNTGSAPSNPYQNGKVGEIRLDNNFIYIYVNEKWIRSPISLWDETVL
jgi:hypothetical protein